MAPNTNQSLELLYEAIDTTSIERLRSMVRDLCASSDTGRKHFSNRLLLSQPTVTANLPAENKENEPAEGSASTSQKRKREEEHVQKRYEMCFQCETEYDVSTNTDTSCVWHVGELEVNDDDDFWADHDERCHGKIDTKDMRKEYPEGFVWDCCSALGDEEGCQTDRHWSMERFKKVRTSLVGPRVG